MERSTQVPEVSRPGAAVKCSAVSSRTGRPCQKWAILGGTVCPTHGGSAPQVKEAAARRIRELIPTALDTLAEVMTDPEASEASRVRAADSILDRGGFKAVDVTVTLDEGSANEALDAAIRQAMLERGHGVPEVPAHTEPHTDEPPAQ